MKKLLKGLMTVTLVFVFVIALTGCGKEETNNDGGKNPDAEKEETYSLTSTNDRLVFYGYDRYEVYYFINNKITKTESATLYGEEMYARQMYTQRGGESNPNIKYIGNVFIELQEDEDFGELNDYNQEELKTYMADSGYELK